MSSLYIRTTFEAWMNDATMVVPFYSTINENQNPTDDIWVTVEYNPSGRDTLTYCGNETREDGDIDVIYTGPAGTGYSTLLAAAEADIKTLMAFRDANNKLILLSAGPPEEFSNGDADMGYEINFAIAYQYID